MANDENDAGAADVGHARHQPAWKKYPRHKLPSVKTTDARKGNWPNYVVPIDRETQAGVAFVLRSRHADAP